MEEGTILNDPDNNFYQELMKEAEQLAHFGGWEVNLLSGEVKWSSEMYNLLGYDHLKTKSTFGNFIKKVHKDDILYIKKNLEVLLGHHSNETYDFRVINSKDGTIKYLRTGIVAKRDIYGRAISLTGFSQDITAQKLAEKKIEQTNKELNTFFNVIDDTFFSIDTICNKLIQVSQGCKKLFGYTATELQADFSLWYNAFHPDDNETIDQANIKLTGGETMVFHYRIIQKNKKIRWVESKIIPKLNSSGKLVRLDGVSRDITERKNNELELQRTENRFRRLVESAQEGIWTIDQNNLTNFVNKKMCDMLGYEPDEMLGKDLLHFVDETDRANIIACIERRKKGAKESLNIRYVTKNGKYVWTNINTNPIFDENGSYNGALAMITDITEQLEHEQSLKESEANLRTVFENTDIAFVLCNLDFNIISFNSRANEYCKLHFGRPLQTAINGLQFLPENRREVLINLFRQEILKKILDYEVNYHTIDKQAKWYLIKWVGVMNEKSEQIGLLLTVKDITEKKLMELEREQITNDLIRRNKDQEQFNYMVSHKLRAPVANISGLVQLLNDADLSDEDKIYALNCLSESIKNVDSVIIDMNEVLQLKNS